VGTTHTAIEAFGEEERPVTAAAGPGGVTWRAAVISLAIILLSVPAIFYGEVVHALYGMGFNATRAGSPYSFPGWYFRASGNEIYNTLTSVEGSEWKAMAWWGLGAVTVVFIAAMRLRFLWWPFHPVGYILGLSVLADEGRGQSPFFIAWLAKSLVLRYGGLRLYQQTLPIAVGLIIGDVLNRSLWNVISLVTHGHL
jgi:hypothetical protein